MVNCHYLGSCRTGLILNLEKLENGTFLRKPGKTWNNQEIFYSIYLSKEKVRENKFFSLHVALVNSYMVVGKGIISFIVSKYKLHHLT